MAARRPGARLACRLSRVSGWVGHTGAALALALGSAPAWAGAPGPLCAAVQRAEAIVEVELQVRDAWPAGYRQKQWAPGPQHLAATVSTARVAARLKGDPVGWTPGFDDLALGRLSMSQWDGLFAAPSVRALVLLQRAEGAWHSVGWLEDGGACSVSLCWAPLQAELRACLGLPAAAPAPVPAR